MTPDACNSSSTSRSISGRLPAGNASFGNAAEAETFVRRSLRRDGVLAGRVETDHGGIAAVLTVAHDYLFGASYGENLRSSSSTAPPLAEGVGTTASAASPLVLRP